MAVTYYKYDAQLLVDSPYKRAFEYAIQQPYSPKSHLMQHGDMASQSLYILNQRYYESYSNVKALPISLDNTGEPDIIKFVTTEGIVKDIEVFIPGIEALAWFIYQENPDLERVKSWFPRKYDDDSVNLNLIAAYFLKNGYLPEIASVKLTHNEILLFNNLKANSYFERIKANTVYELQSMMQSRGALSVPKIRLTVEGIPTAIMYKEVKRTKVPFKTAFINFEYFPEIFNEIQTGLRYGN